jgi:hypothetical protein
MFACLQFRFNQLSIVIRHRSVKSILRGILFEASVPQVLLHAVRKSYNQRTRLFFAEREKGGKGNDIIFQWRQSWDTSCAAEATVVRQE